MNFDKYMINATPEQKIFFDRVVLKVGDNQITPFFFEGIIAGSELLTYNANKLYFALDLELSTDPTPLPTPGYGWLYDETNTIFFHLNNNSLYYDATATAYKAVPNNAITKNVYFSRLSVQSITKVKFIGFKTIV